MCKRFFSRVIPFLLSSLVLTLAPIPLHGSPSAHPDPASASWSVPENLSNWVLSATDQVLRFGPDGTQAVFWWEYTGGPAHQRRLWARVRTAAGAWTAAQDITGWQTSLSDITVPPIVPIPTMGIAPDGTVWIVWATKDEGRPTPNQRVMAARKLAEGPWQTDPLSDWQVQIRSTDMHIGPDGDMAATWVACSGTNTTQGPCAVHIRRRPAGASVWEPLTRIDDATPVSGRTQAFVRIGPGGLIVVQWLQYVTNSTSYWAAMARAYNPMAGAWGTGATQVCFRNVRSLQKPVMGVDGTVVAAWSGDSSDPAKEVISSATRAAGSGVWSAPAELSPRYAITGQTGFTDFELAVSRNGTVVAAWDWWVSGTQKAIYANARDAGGIWGGPQQVSAWEKYIVLSGLDTWPGGTTVVLWSAADDARPASADSALFWSGRPPNGNWGGGGSGQLGSWTGGVYGASLALGDDGSAVVLAATGEPDPPVGPQMSVSTFPWPPGGPWGAPEILATGSQYTYVKDGALIVGPGGRPVGAVWRVSRDSDSKSAVFYSGFAEEPPRQRRIFLPVAMRK